MSDISIGHCHVCGRVRYDCVCDMPGTDEREPLREFATLTREEKCVLWVLGRLDMLKKAKLVDTSVEVTPRGIAAFDQFEASGFRPSISEIRNTLAAMNEINPSEVLDCMVGLVYRYREDDPV